MSVRRNAALTITFEAIDPSYRPARKSGLSIANTSCWISKDGGNFANTTNGATELTGVTGRYSLALTAAEMDASWIHIVVEKTGMDPASVIIGTSGAPSGAVIASPTPTTLAFGTSLTEATSSHWKDALIVFTSGTLLGQVKKISAYDGSTKVITVSSAFTGAPSSTDRFVLINI